MGQRRGNFLYDMDGQKQVFNLHCNGGVFNLGHRNQELIDALIEATGELDIGNHHLVSRERASLAKALADTMPEELNTTVFSVGGGEAVDLAIKIACGNTGRTEIISACGGYHGHTGLALAAGDEKYRKPFALTADGFSQVPFNDLEALEKQLSDKTAAVILETVPATLGIVLPETGYLPSVADLCKKNGSLLIIDEVQTGLGRTGKLWGFEHFDVTPDIVIIGKGLSGGIYPIAATVIKDSLYHVFEDDPFIHISTFGGAELGCRVASKVLEITASKDFLLQVEKMSLLFSQGLSQLQKKHSKTLLKVHQLGLMVGLVLAGEDGGKIMTKAAYDNDLLMVYAGNDPSICQCMPPLTITENDIDFIITKLDSSLKSHRQLQHLLGGKQKINRLLRRKSKL